MRRIISTYRRSRNVVWKFSRSANTFTRGVIIDFSIVILAVELDRLRSGSESTTPCCQSKSEKMADRDK